MEAVAVTNYLLLANLVVVTICLVLTIKEAVEKYRKKKEDNFPL